MLLYLLLATSFLELSLVLKISSSVLVASKVTPTPVVGLLHQTTWLEPLRFSVASHQWDPMLSQLVASVTNM